MIASGALPTLYSPVEINRVLIDGGVVDNYPIEELKIELTLLLVLMFKMD